MACETQQALFDAIPRALPKACLCRGLYDVDDGGIPDSDLFIYAAAARVFKFRPQVALNEEM